MSAFPKGKDILYDTMLAFIDLHLNENEDQPFKCTQ